MIHDAPNPREVLQPAALPGAPERWEYGRDWLAETEQDFPLVEPALNKTRKRTEPKGT